MERRKKSRKRKNYDVEICEEYISSSQTSSYSSSQPHPDNYESFNRQLSQDEVRIQQNHIYIKEIRQCSQSSSNISPPPPVPPRKKSRNNDCGPTTFLDNNITWGLKTQVKNRVDNVASKKEAGPSSASNIIQNPPLLPPKTKVHSTHRDATRTNLDPSQFPSSNSNFSQHQNYRNNLNRKREREQSETSFENQSDNHVPASKRLKTGLKKLWNRQADKAKRKTRKLEDDNESVISNSLNLISVGSNSDRNTNDKTDDAYFGKLSIKKEKDENLANRAILPPTPTVSSKPSILHWPQFLSATRRKLSKSFHDDGPKSSHVPKYCPSDPKCSPIPLTRPPRFVSKTPDSIRKFSTDSSSVSFLEKRISNNAGQQGTVSKGFSNICIKSNDVVKSNLSSSITIAKSILTFDKDQYREDHEDDEVLSFLESNEGYQELVESSAETRSLPDIEQSFVLDDTGSFVLDVTFSSCSDDNEGSSALDYRDSYFPNFDMTSPVDETVIAEVLNNFTIEEKDSKMEKELRTGESKEKTFVDAEHTIDGSKYYIVEEPKTNSGEVLAIAEQRNHKSGESPVIEVEQNNHQSTECITEKEQNNNNKNMDHMTEKEQGTSNCDCQGSSGSRDDRISTPFSIFRRIFKPLKKDKKTNYCKRQNAAYSIK